MRVWHSSGQHIVRNPQGQRRRDQDFFILVSATMETTCPIMSRSCETIDDQCQAEWRAVEWSLGSPRGIMGHRRSTGPITSSMTLSPPPPSFKRCHSFPWLDPVYRGIRFSDLLFFFFFYLSSLPFFLFEEFSFERETSSSRRFRKWISLKGSSLASFAKDSFY